MKVSPRINEYRRRFTRSLTKNVGEIKIPKDGNPIKPDEIKSILIIRPNHRLGNQLLVIPLVEELMAAFPNAKIDLFLKGGLGPILFQHFDPVNRIMRMPRKPMKELGKYIKSWFAVKSYKYDMVINVVNTSSSGRLITNMSRGRYKFFDIEEEEAAAKSKQFQYDFKHIAKASILSLREYLAQLGYDRRHEPIPLMRLRLTDEERQKGKRELEAIADSSKKTICIFTYATRDKCYTKDWWKDCYESLQEKFPDCNIVEMLPAEKVSQVDFAAPHYYSRDIMEMTGFLAACDVFIGADSGIMHLSSASGVATIGLFKVTKAIKYEPYGPKNIAVDTTQVPMRKLMEQVQDYL